MSFLDGARSFIDKFGFFGGDEDLGTDEEFDEAEDSEDEDNAEDHQGSIFDRLRRAFGSKSNEEEEPEPENAPGNQPYTKNPSGPAPNNIIRDDRMTNRGASQAARVQPPHRAHVIQVRQIDECREIIKFLLDGETVLLNLENADPKDCGRIVDLLSGAAYALQGRMLKVAHLCYLLAPQDVEIINESIQRTSPANYGKYS